MPTRPRAIACVIYAAIMTDINLKDAMGLSRIESWLASIKVMALILFVIFGILTTIVKNHRNVKRYI